MAEQTDELRRTGLGGSDMAAVLGIDPYKGPLDVWMNKIGHAPPDDLSDNDAVWFGKNAETLVASYFTRRTGIDVRAVHQTQRHPEHDFLMAHPDRRIVGASAGLEIKTANWRMREHWGDEGTDEIPENYLAQCHHYMMVMDWERMHVACLMGADLKLYVVPRNTAWDAALLDAGVEFWNRYVLPKRMPDLDYNALTLRALKKMYPLPVADTIMRGDELAHLVDTQADLSERITTAEKARDVIDAMLLEAVKDREWCVLPDGRSMHRITVNEGVVPSYTRKAYSYLREVKTPKAIQAMVPTTITQEVE